MKRSTLSGVWQNGDVLVHRLEDEAPVLDISAVRGAITVNPEH